MNEDTRLEVIKALAHGLNKEDIANMADIDDVAVIEAIEMTYAGDVVEARKRMKALEG